jgi:hypothetical protein
MPHRGLSFCADTVRLVSSKTGRRIHLWLMLVWVVVGLPLSFLLRQSVPWLVFLSVYAIIVGHWSGWSAERPSEVEGQAAGDATQ